VSEHEHERLSAYLDGELPPEEMSRVAAHVAACAECAARLAEFAAVDEAAAALAANAPSGYFEALPGRMRSRLEPRGSGARKLPAWTWAVAAALLLAVVTPLTLSRRPALQTAPAREQPAAAPIPAPEAPASSEPASPPALEPPPAKLQKALPRQAAPPPPAAPGPGMADSAAPLASQPQASQPQANAAPSLTDLRLKREQEGFAAPPADAERRPAEPAPEARRDAPVGALSAPAAGAFSRVEPAKPKAVPERETAAPDEEALARERAAQPAAPAREQKATDAAAEAQARGSLAESLQVDAVGARSKSDYDEKDAAADQEWRRLLSVKPQTVEEWRRLREELRGFVESAPDGPHADAARLRTIEAGYAAWRSSGDAADETLFRRDAAAYLKRGEDAKNKPRARELLLSR
jgi:hypothetical protein